MWLTEADCVTQTQTAWIQVEYVQMNERSSEQVEIPDLVG